MSPPFIGLTGGVGAGKSEALAALGRLGAATISSDAVVHELLGRGELRELLVRRWGPAIAPAGEVDRNRIASIVFDDPDELQWLERELHPRVGERIASWRESLPTETELAVVEVPLLFETGMEPLFDAVICIVAPDALREGRAAGRGLGDLAGRGARQLSQEEKAARATHVVRNEGTLEDLERELARLLPSLRSPRGVA